MSKRAVITIGLSLVSSISIVGCADDTAPPQCDLPGDIDCAPPASGGGKADGFDYKNDPARMSQHLTYRLSDLPKQGDRTQPYWKDQYPEAVGHAEAAWADTYWPTSEGSHNNRWQGPSTPSPLEKYDAAFNSAPGCTTYPSAFYGAGAKAEWDTYNGCAGPAAKWQTSEFQGGGEMHDGIDNDGDGKIDDTGDDGSVDGIQGWWGTCHAWTPASMLFPEPQHEVTENGVTFAVGDIKALLQNMSDQTSAVMLGGRCNSKEITHDVHGSANDDCRDVNPGALHVIMTNYLGLTNLPLIEDRTKNYEVWNQPVVGYKVTQLDKISAADAMKAVGNTGNTWTYNDKAKELYEVQLTVKYITESYPSTTPVGFANNTREDSYHYILELDAAGKIIGGRFATDSETTGIDFLWAPTGSVNPSNPYVDVAKVKRLLAASVAPAGGAPTGDAKTFTATPGSSIPDNDPTGVSTDIAVSGLTGAPSLTVSVNISHTYRGDLVIELYKDGSLVKTLLQNEGGSTHDVVESYNVGAVESPNGTYTLKVTDTAAQDVGTVNSITLAFQ